MPTGALRLPTAYVRPLVSAGAARAQRAASSPIQARPHAALPAGKFRGGQWCRCANGLRGGQLSAQSGCGQLQSRATLKLRRGQRGNFASAMFGRPLPRPDRPDELQTSRCRQFCESGLRVIANALHDRPLSTRDGASRVHQFKPRPLRAADRCDGANSLRAGHLSG